jgi:hypothetical protein
MQRGMKQKFRKNIMFWVCCVNQMPNVFIIVCAELFAFWYGFEVRSERWF